MGSICRSSRGSDKEIWNENNLLFFCWLFSTSLARCQSSISKGGGHFLGLGLVLAIYATFFRFPMHRKSFPVCTCLVARLLSDGPVFLESCKDSLSVRRDKVERGSSGQRVAPKQINAQQFAVGRPTLPYSTITMSTTTTILLLLLLRYANQVPCGMDLEPTHHHDLTLFRCCCCCVPLNGRQVMTTATWTSNSLLICCCVFSFFLWYFNVLLTLRRFSIYTHFYFSFYYFIFYFLEGICTRTCRNATANPWLCFCILS